MVGGRGGPPGRGRALRRPFSGGLAQASRLEGADPRQDLLAEALDVLVVVEEAAQDEVHAQLLEGHDPLRDLVGGADQPGAEAVVVLDQVLEVRVGPHALLVLGGLAGLFTRLAAPGDRLDVALAMISRSTSCASFSVS